MSPDSAVLSTKSQKFVNVLLIEDSDFDKDRIVSQLEDERIYQVHSCNSYESTVNFLEDKSDEEKRPIDDIDVVLLDYQLGDGTGLELLPKLITANLPVIFVAGSSTSGIILEAMRSGAYDYIVKDGKWFFLETISSTINTVIKRHSNEKLLQKRTDDLERSNEELKSYAHTIAHDLKSPLRSICNYSSLLLRAEKNKLSDKSQEMLSFLTSSSKKMSQLVDDLLRYSEISFTDVPQETFKAREVVDEVISLINPPEGISFLFPAELPEITYARTFFHQIFQNLLTNAVKYMGKDTGKVMISARVRSGGKEYEFCVKDTGLGIAQDQQEKIFQIFQTAGHQKTEESTGVGLSIVKKIIEKQGGQIRVESKEGSGTGFYFTVPIIEE